VAGQPDREKESVKGGNHHPGFGQRKPQEGEVIAAGAGKIEKGVRVPLDVKVGDPFYSQIQRQRNPRGR